MGSRVEEHKKKKKSVELGNCSVQPDLGLECVCSGNKHDNHYLSTCAEGRGATGLSRPEQNSNRVTRRLRPNED